MKRAVLRGVVMVASVALTLAACELAFRLAAAVEARRYFQEPGLHRIDSRFGWTLAANARVRHVMPDFDVTYHTDAQGLRVTTDNEPDGLRVGVYGDSFVFGVGVSDSQTLPSRLSARLRHAMVRNEGVMGYSPDQEYLRFADDMLHPERRPDISVFVIYPGNDLDGLVTSRMVTECIGSTSPPKPMLARSGTAYQMIYEAPDPPKVRESLRLRFYCSVRQSALLRFVYDRRASLPFVPSVVGAAQTWAYRVDDRTLDEGLSRLDWCVARIRAASPRTMFVIVPSRNLALRETPQGREATYYEGVANVLKHQKVPFVDLLSAWPAANPYYLSGDGHLSADGTGAVADLLIDRFRALGWNDVR